MPLGQGIAELLGAIPHRIEVAGHAPTWRITADSFDAALDFARECHGDPTVLAVARRDRWWARVTLTVTTDPALAAGAPPLAELRAASEPPPAPEPPAPEKEHRPVERHRLAPAYDDSAADDPADVGGSALEEIFAHQEELRAARRRVPRQRRRPEQ